jgi:UDP-glucose 4-epimerase
VFKSVEEVDGRPLKIVDEPRRAGDPPELVAVANRVREVLGWEPQTDDIDAIVRSSLAGERKIAARDPGAFWRD